MSSIQVEEYFSTFLTKIKNETSIDILLNQDLKKYSRWKIGGKADLLIEPNNLKELK